MRRRGRRRRRSPLRTALALLVLLPWLAWAVVRTAGLDDRHPLVAVMSFTTYAAATSVVPLLVALVLGRLRVAVLAIATCVAFALAVVPRAVEEGPRETAGDPEPLTVMTANMRKGSADPATIVGLVRSEHVDVLALEELTPEGVRRLDAAGLDELLPHRAFEARPGAAGTGLTSRRPLRREQDVVMARVAAQPQVTVSTGTHAVRILAVHPPPPVDAAQEPTWSAALAGYPRGDNRPGGLLLGDFNATLDHAAFRDLLDTGWRDAADATGSGLRPTWRQPRFPPITIDHVLMGAEIRATRTVVRQLPHSDHRAVIAHLLVG